ncbi:SAM and U-box domain-containing protein 1 [Seminavis robusta]|uniref:SAM and U-box domain-containing protein 1 n=1 Tax=Seminavis robusta TaxID=568900 RepID=A0A9N8DFD0_9STRA|nr:SAM and U-box domain-containing protein 1 [Seminavis robusta]|eukprot:Sro43_g025910.1 SAM and U-box domain-containing protein 1 (548) ;mRNA; f:10211-11854
MMTLDEHDTAAATACVATTSYPDAVVSAMIKTNGLSQNEAEEEEILVHLDTTTTTDEDAEMGLTLNQTASTCTDSSMSVEPMNPFDSPTQTGSPVPEAKSTATTKRPPLSCPLNMEPPVDSSMSVEPMNPFDSPARTDSPVPEAKSTATTKRPPLLCPLTKEPLVDSSMSVEPMNPFDSPPRTHSPVPEAKSTANKRPPLLCPLTMEPLVDPVVCPTDGVSYERSAIVSEEDEDLYYPNRALKDCIEMFQEDDAEDNAQDDDGGTSSNMGTVTTEDILDLFVCPITQELMRDPVIDQEGNTYERSAVVNWIQQHGVSPITRKPLTVELLYDNTTLFMILIQEIQLLKQQEEENNDEVQQWKTDVSGTDNTETTSGDSDFACSSQFLEELQPQGQLQDLEASHQEPNLIFPELALVAEAEQRRQRSRNSSSRGRQQRNRRRPPPVVHYDTPNVNDLVRREQQVARERLYQLEQEHRRLNRRKSAQLFAVCLICAVLVMFGLYFVLPLAAAALLLFIFGVLAMSMCIGGLPCDYTMGSNGGLSSALNRI